MLTQHCVTVFRKKGDYIQYKHSVWTKEAYKNTRGITKSNVFKCSLCDRVLYQWVSYPEEREDRQMVFCPPAPPSPPRDYPRTPFTLLT